jgi:hypothetical protein
LPPLTDTAETNIVVSTPSNRDTAATVHHRRKRSISAIESITVEGYNRPSLIDVQPLYRPQRNSQEI